MPEIKIQNAVAHSADVCFAQPVNFTLSEGENLTIIGPNGAGKSLLIDLMMGKIRCKIGSARIEHDGQELRFFDLKYISFRDIYRMAGSDGGYYQQKWNATENEESPFVADLLGRTKIEKARDIIADLRMESVVEKRLINLSSGELRKMQILRALMAYPKLLIIDNPFIGLDAESRATVNALLKKIHETDKTQIILVITNTKDMPEWIEKVLPVVDMSVMPTMTRETFLSDSALRSRMFPNTDNEEIVLPRQEMSDCSDYLNAVIFNSVNVRYYTKQILRDVSWVVRRNDKWALLGKNGCGKSTLLSLICGDNPQGYANDITLFDRKRGTGESIWDIKSHIGYLSPDMHTYYRENISCEDVVSSGFFDQIGLYRKPNDLQRAMARRWLKTFHAEDIADKPFLSSSFGEQRLALLVRAFVKSPSLLILDEPLHGLDESKKRIAKRVVEQYCREKNATLIYVTHYEEEIPECVTERKTLVKPE